MSFDGSFRPPIGPSPHVAPGAGFPRAGVIVHSSFQDLLSKELSFLAQGYDIPTSYRQLLANRSYRWLLIGGAATFAAPTGVSLILVWAVAVAYPTSAPSGFAPLALALLGISATLPTLAAALVSGTLADRINRRWLMIVVNAAAIVAVFGLLLVFLFRPSTSISVPGPSGFYVPLYLLLAFPLWSVVTVCSVMFRPALNASLPRVVETAELGTANGFLFGVAIVLSIVVSLGATGSLESRGYVLALVLPLALYLIAQGALYPLPTNLSQTRSGPRESFLADAKAGYAYLWHRRVLLQLTLAALVINFLNAMAFVELGFYVRTWLNVGQPILYGSLVAAATLGVAVGSILISRIHFERRVGSLLILFILGEGLTVLAFGLIRSIWLAIPDFFVFGMFPGMFQTAFLATVQATVPDEVMGRVMAADEVGSLGLVPAGQYIGGILTAAVGVQVTYLAAGGGTGLLSAVLATSSRVRKLGFDPGQPSRKVPLPPEPAAEPLGAIE
ncbi:MAG: MFS transporter [Thermoplasmata archaeon]